MLAITKMSENGQVVIPSEIRKEAKIKPATQFIVLEKNGNIILQQLDKEKMVKAAEKEFYESVRRGIKDIKEGRFLKVDGNMSVKEMDARLMDKKK